MLRIGTHSPVRVLSILILALALHPGASSSQLPAMAQRAWEGISSELRDTLEVTGMVGASWGAFADGELVTHETFGHADLETGRRVDDRTIYHWGSITKTLTGIAIMQLRDRGLLRLDDAIIRYVPELETVHNPYGEMEDITLRHLLSHTSGFRNSTWPWGGSEDWHPHEPTSWDQIVAMLPYTEVLFPPGSRISYSNPGLIFLGQVIQRLTGEEWEVYIEKNVLRPLGMHRSYFDYTPYHLLADRSNNYRVSGGIALANGLDFDTGITVSNGGLNAPLEDMARYLAFLTDSGVGEDRSNYAHVLSRSSLLEMWNEAVPMEGSGGFRETLGLTFFVVDFEGTRYIGHTGTQKAFHSFFYIHPETGTGVLAAFNSNGVSEDSPPRPPTAQIRVSFRERLFRELFPLLLGSGS
jgi:CubicO group peptidase (beta-lactamase class C family)